MKDEEILKKLKKYMKKAQDKHPNWPTDRLKAVVNVCEEAGELLKEVNNIQGIIPSSFFSCPRVRDFDLSHFCHSNCPFYIECEKTSFYLKCREKIEEEAFHTLVTIVRFLRNIERY